MTSRIWLGWLTASTRQLSARPWGRRTSPSPPATAESLEIAGGRPLAGLSDAGIAITGALVLFCLPDGRGGRVLDWETASGLPWGILILFGGGLSLAAAIGSNGVDDWIGAQSAVLAGLPSVVIVVAVVAVMVFLTELTSNTASTAALVPILASLAGGLGLSPLHAAGGDTAQRRGLRLRTHNTSGHDPGGPVAERGGNRRDQSVDLLRGAAAAGGLIRHRSATARPLRCQSGGCGPDGRGFPERS